MTSSWPTMTLPTSDAQRLEGGDELLDSLLLRLSRLGRLDHSRLLSLRAATAA